MAVTPQNEPGERALEKANPDRVNFQRGKKIRMRGKVRPRRGRRRKR